MRKHMAQPTCVNHEDTDTYEHKQTCHPPCSLTSLVLLVVQSDTSAHDPRSRCCPSCVDDDVSLALRRWPSAVPVPAAPLTHQRAQAHRTSILHHRTTRAYCAYDHNAQWQHPPHRGMCVNVHTVAAPTTAPLPVAAVLSPEIGDGRFDDSDVGDDSSSRRLSSNSWPPLAWCECGRACSARGQCRRVRWAYMSACVARDACAQCQRPLCDGRL